MPKNDLNVTLKGIDELLFSTEEQRQEEKREQVQQIPMTIIPGRKCRAN